MKLLKLALAALFIPFSVNILAQENTSDVEEIIVVGTQIKGADITGVLPVTVMSIEDIEALGVSDGDELVENLVEQGLKGLLFDPGSF